MIYNIAVNFKYCLILDPIPAENINKNRIVISYLINNLATNKLFYQVI